MNEASFWSTWLRGYLHDPRHGRVGWKVPAELRKGLPDVWYSDRRSGAQGWVELKYVPSWPVRATTGVEVAMSPEQKAHLLEAYSGGARAFVLLGVADQIYLLWPRLLIPMEKYPRPELEARSAYFGPRQLAFPGLARPLGFLL